MGSVSGALAAAARRVRRGDLPGCCVSGIVVGDDGAACGVEVDGSVVAARTVASNAHPHTTFLDLLDSSLLDSDIRREGARVEDERAVAEAESRARRTARFHLPSRDEPQPHHRATIHVATSIDYLQKAYEDAAAGGESEEPLIECFLQTPTDSSLAPPGKHILSIFAQYFPYDRADGWSEAKREAAADKIVAILARYAPNFPNAIEHRQVLAAPDLESRFGLIGGHIFHGELLPGQIYENRFATRTPVRNLYLCGSGAHPGGCVSGFPGKRAARTIVCDIAGSQTTAT